MSNPTLDPQSTALVVIDLHRSIAGSQTLAFSAQEVVARSAQLAKRFRERRATVVLVGGCR